MGNYPTTYSEFRTYYIAHEAWDDGTYESAQALHRIQQQYPTWYKQLQAELV